MGRCQGEKLACAIERFERRVGIVPIRRIQRILRVVLVGRVERVVGVVPIRWIDGVTRIIAVCRVERIVRRIGLCRVERVIRRILTGRIEDIVVAIVLLREAWFGKRRSGEEEATEEPDHPHGEPPNSGTTSGLSLLPAGDQRKHRQALPEK